MSPLCDSRVGIVGPFVLFCFFDLNYIKVFQGKGRWGVGTSKSCSLTVWRMHWEGKCWEHHSLIRPCLSKSRASHSRWWQLAWVVCTLHHKCRIANLYSSLCCLMPFPIPLPRLGSKSDLLQLVSATVGKSLEKATIGTDTSLWGIDTCSNVIYVCVVYVSVCLSTSRPTWGEPPQGNPASVPARLPIRAWPMSESAEQSNAA